MVDQLQHATEALRKRWSRWNIGTNRALWANSSRRRDRGHVVSLPGGVGPPRQMVAGMMSEFRPWSRI